MSTMSEIVERGKAAVMQNYSRYPVVMVRGEGSTLWDADGKKYIDLFAGFGGTVLGHAHPELVKAAGAQAGMLWAVGNQLWTVPQIEFAERLRKTAFEGQAFFCHSGAEANEAACKLARLRGSDKSPRRWKIVSLQKSFHGRTLAMIAATGNPAVRVGFEPEVSGFVRVEPGNFEALSGVVDDETAGMIMEPIQGEGGINLFPLEYVQKVRKLCDEKGVTLIFDEVWTGCGRTGKWFGHQWFGGIEPDVMTLGKAAGGGLPVGVMYAKPEWAKLFAPGKHGSTLGGNPICMAVSRTLFDVIEKEKLVERANTLGEAAMARLRKESSIKEKVKEVRGHGLMIGVELKQPPEKLVDKGLEAGVLINLTNKNVIRLAPALNIPERDWNAGLDAVVKVIAAV
jgi:acetylornithine/N-succinyldiaminopimelate aminotransferase